jgi:hypothetical protein
LRGSTHGCAVAHTVGSRAASDAKNKRIYRHRLANPSVIEETLRRGAVPTWPASSRARQLLPAPLDYRWTADPNQAVLSGFRRSSGIFEKASKISAFAGK